MSERTYRRARCALACGIAAVLLEGGAVWSLQAYLDAEEPSDAFTNLVTWLAWGKIPGTFVAIVGVAYAAVASHCKEWGPSLVLGWLLSAGALLLEPQPFVFTQF